MLYLLFAADSLSMPDQAELDLVRWRISEADTNFPPTPPPTRIPSPMLLATVRITEEQPRMSWLS